MAGGIDWFRWHHGSTNDPKFRLVAKRACARVGDVIAMWAMLLEQASAAEDRGNPGNIDFEAIDLALDMDDGAAQAIYTAMTSRELIDAECGRVVAWERRQPKRERPDDNSTDRSREFRAKQRQATPPNANDSHATPREEESREEQSSLRSDSIGASRSKSGKGYTPEFESAWAAYPARPGDSKADAFKAWSARLKAGAAVEQMAGGVSAYAAYCIATETSGKFVKQGATFFGPGEHYLADWTPPPRASPAGPAETAFQRSQRERVERMSGGLVSAKPPGQAPKQQEVFDVTT